MIYFHQFKQNKNLLAKPHKSHDARRLLTTAAIWLVAIFPIGSLVLGANLSVINLASQHSHVAEKEGDIEANGDFSAPKFIGAWALMKPAQHHEIEGYASLDSVTPGSSVGLDVSCVNPAQFKTDIFRMGYYNQAGALLAGQIGYTRCSKQNAAIVNQTTGLIDTRWTQTQHLVIPKTWQPGYYLARLTSTSGYQSYIPFLVRSAQPTSKYLFVDAVATSAAYNDWGGNSLYVGYTPAARVNRAFKVSLNRPYTVNNGAGEFLNWEYSMVRYLERTGYKVDYATDVDIDTSPALLLNYKAVIISGHDEYWTWPMLGGYQAAVKAGVNLAIFGANTDYRPTRIEDDSLSGQPNRIVVDYKAYQLDPLWQTYLSKVLQNLNNYSVGLYQVTGFNWRDYPFNLPESQLLGESFRDLTATPGSYTVPDASNWVFAGAGLHNGSVLPGIVGYEYDKYDTNFPAPTGATVTVLLNAALSSGDTANATIYQVPGGGQVFDAGTNQWSWGLNTVLNTYNPALDKITSNILNQFGQ